jgi:hypothetical protein
MMLGDPLDLSRWFKFNTIRFLETARNSREDDGALLTKLLAKTRGCSCQDPRDRIFSLLGLLLQRLYPSLQADYVAPYQQAFALAARECIKVDGKVDILRAASLVCQSDESLLSWVPDWCHYS